MFHTVDGPWWLKSASHLGHSYCSYLSSLEQESLWQKPGCSFSLPLLLAVELGKQTENSSNMVLLIQAFRLYFISMHTRSTYVSIVTSKQNKLHSAAPLLSEPVVALDWTSFVLKRMNSGIYRKHFEHAWWIITDFKVLVCWLHIHYVNQVFHLKCDLLDCNLLQELLDNSDLMGLVQKPVWCINVFIRGWKW